MLKEKKGNRKELKETRKTIYKLNEHVNKEKLNEEIK